MDQALTLSRRFFFGWNLCVNLKRVKAVSEAMTLEICRVRGTGCFFDIGAS